jgi:hypothetical protein
MVRWLADYRKQVKLGLNLPINVKIDGCRVGWKFNPVGHGTNSTQMQDSRKSIQFSLDQLALSSPHKPLCTQSKNSDGASRST